MSMTLTAAGMTPFLPPAAARAAVTPASARAAAPSSELERKISDSLAADREKFLRLQAAELKKRLSFYQNFPGQAGERAYREIAIQAYRLAGEFYGMGRG